MRNYDPKLLTQFPVTNGFAPGIDEGARCIPILLDFGADGDVDVNAAEAQVAGKIGQVQSLYIDNTLNAFPLVIVVKSTLQRITIPAQTEAIRPIFADAVFQAVFSSTVSAAIVRVMAFNVPLAPYTYGPLTANVVSSAVTGVYTNRSRAATGGATDILMAANALRKGYIIQNPSTEIESIWVNFTAAATIGSPSIEITPGSSFPPYGGISTEQINVIAATAAHPIIAKELA